MENDFHILVYLRGVKPVGEKNPNAPFQIDITKIIGLGMVQPYLTESDLLSRGPEGFTFEDPMNGIYISKICMN